MASPVASRSSQPPRNPRRIASPSDWRASAESSASERPSDRGVCETDTDGNPASQRPPQRKHREIEVNDEENYDTCPSDSEERQVSTRGVVNYNDGAREWSEAEEEIPPDVRSRIIRKDDRGPHRGGPSGDARVCKPTRGLRWQEAEEEIPPDVRSRIFRKDDRGPHRGGPSEEVDMEGKLEEGGVEDTKGDRRAKHNSTTFPHVKLGAFKGESCLETFLAKFENLSAYVGWSARDRLFHLQASLEGAAGQVLWDAGTQTSAEEIVRRLRARFGNEHQSERFRAELRSRRRKKGETLQAVYNDVCRLLALAYPGPTNATTVIVGRDAFLDALNNHEMRIRVLEKEPSTLEEALSIACRLEAYERVPIEKAVEEIVDEDRGRNRIRHARQLQVASASDVRDRALEQITQQLAELRQMVGHREANREPRGPAEAAPAVNAWSRPATTAPVAPAADVVDSNSYYAYPPPGAAPRRTKGRGGPARAGCFQCGDPTHWKNECPYRLTQLPTAGPEGNRVGVISAQVRSAEIYVDVSIRGVLTLSILDTG